MGSWTPMDFGYQEQHSRISSVSKQGLAETDRGIHHSITFGLSSSGILGEGFGTPCPSPGVKGQWHHVGHSWECPVVVAAELIPHLEGSHCKHHWDPKTPHVAFGDPQQGWDHVGQVWGPTRGRFGHHSSSSELDPAVEIPRNMSKTRILL